LDIIPITISHTAHLSWTDRSTDQQQKPVNFADRYRVQLSTSSNFESLIVDATTENTSYTTSELSPDAYYWRVRSETNGGLVTEWNTPRKFVIASGAATNENIASVSILSPTSGTTVSNDLPITGSCSDSDGTVEYVQIKIDSGTWIKVSGTISWSYDLDTTELENGLHTLYARAWDGENYSPIKSVSLTVDNIEIDDSTGNSGRTPGFELVIVVCAIALVLLWKRKRIK